MQEPAKKDLTPLTEFSSDIRYIASGYEVYPDMLLNLDALLKDFNPDTDAIVPVGRVIPAFLIGMRIQRLFPDKTITIGIYANKTYTFIRLTE